MSSKQQHKGLRHVRSVSTVAGEEVSNQNKNNNNGNKETHHDLSNQGIDDHLLKPLWVADTITNHPCITCCGCFIIVIILAFIDTLVFNLTQDTDRTWLQEDSQEVYNYDTWTLATEAMTHSDNKNEYITPQTQQDSLWTIQWIFELNNYDKKINKHRPENTDYWILTPENLEIILGYEEQNTMDPKWIDRFCYVIDTHTFKCDYDSIARDVAEHFDYDFDS